MKHVTMKRDASFPPPHSVDVHPDEVANYHKGGFREIDPLDHDANGKKVGSKPAKKAKASQDETAGNPPLTRREIEADLTAMGEDFNPAADLDELRRVRDEARAILEA